MNMNNMLSVPVGAPRSEAPAVCRSPKLKKLPEFSVKEMALCPLPQDDPVTLRRAFDAAPQFRALKTDELLSRAARGMRILMRADNIYYAIQAAAYLTALSGSEGRKPQPNADEDDLLFDDEDGLLFDDEDGILIDEEEFMEILCEEPNDVFVSEGGMAVISPALLDPDLGKPEDGPATMMAMMQTKVLDLRQTRSDAVVIAAESGPVLSAGVVEQLEAVLDQECPPHVFVVLKAGQLDLAMLEDLRFRLGFRVCEVGTPDAAYLRAVLSAAAAEQGLTLAPDLDADAVLAGLRAYRGAAYTDADIDCLLARAAERAQPNRALGTADLLPRRSRLGRRSAAEALEQMIGLEGVKETLRRALAVQILNRRRGRPDADACRNLAFCGAPGTGKSVTARLVAEILRDEGCGTGRFVEAGREQLIGKYTGHTSPKIAKLFEQAAGGVLFIDEAGALLGSEQDDYANEAVNALVRHMELHPETMVIFATYEPEMRRLLASNAGLSSRVAGIIRFDDYTDAELCRILALTARRAGETVSDEAADGCAGFFAALRRRKGEDFGNGREARRLFEAAREEMALRCNADAGERAEIFPCDLDAAVQRLLEMEKAEEKTRQIGF